MNINQLRFMQALAVSGSFSKAAERCHVTQPTLSNAIAQLESELGSKLFERTTRSVSLTPFGQHMLVFIEKALDEIDEIGIAANNWNQPQQKLIRLGLSPVVDIHVLQEILSSFRQSHPEIEFFFKECYLDDLNERLQLGQLDVVIMPPRRNIAVPNQVTLYSEPLYYVPCHGSHVVNADAKSVTLSATSQENLILTIDACGLRGVTQELFQDNHLHLKEYPGQATSYSVIEDWAEIGIGAGILPKSKISKNNQLARPLLLDNGEQASISCQAVWAKPPVHVQMFVEHLTGLA